MNIEEKEDERLQKMNELTSKITHTPAKAEKLDRKITDTYVKLVDDENTAKQTASRLGVNLPRVMNNVAIKQKVEQVKENLAEIKQKCEIAGKIQNCTFEEISEISSKLMPLLDGVVYSEEVTRNFPDIVNSHKIQIDSDIIRSLYERVHKVIQNARIKKYTKEQEEISSEKVGIFGRLLGRDILKEEKLRNINLKIKSEQTSTPKIETKCSVQDILSEIYASAISEFDGQFTPEMAEIFTTIKSAYSSHNFSDEEISNLAMQRITDRQKEILPSVPSKKVGFFRKNKAQAEELRIENKRLQIQVEENVYNGNKWDIQDKGKDSVLDFENQLDEILVSIKSKQPDREPIKEEITWE